MQREIVSARMVIPVVECWWGRYGLSFMRSLGLVEVAACRSRRSATRCRSANCSACQTLAEYFLHEYISSQRLCSQQEKWYFLAVSGVPTMLSSTKQLYTFVVEHLDPELGPWSALEYKTISEESTEAGCAFILSSVPESLLKSQELQAVGAQARPDSVETYFADRKDKICLLDPAAKQELDPSDGDRFEVFLFGGILGRSFYLRLLPFRKLTKIRR